VEKKRTWMWNGFRPVQCVYVWLAVRSFLHSVHLPTRLPTYPSAYLPAYIIYPPTHPPTTYLHIYPPTHPLSYLDATWSAWRFPKAVISAF
jgi:hypothetical protein